MPFDKFRIINYQVRIQSDTSIHSYSFFLSTLSKTRLQKIDDRDATQFIMLVTIKQTPPPAFQVQTSQHQKPCFLSSSS